MSVQRGDVISIGEDEVGVVVDVAGDAVTYKTPWGKYKKSTTSAVTKNDEAAAGHVRFCLAPQKTSENSEKRSFRTNFHFRFFF